LVVAHKEVLGFLDENDFVQSIVTASGPLYVIVEYCAVGNLLNFLRDSRPKVDCSTNYEEPNSRKCAKKILTTQDLVQFALQVARGMMYLSERKVKMIFIPVNFMLEIVYCSAFIAIWQHGMS